jgi:hypothetical protein
LQIQPGAHLTEFELPNGWRGQFWVDGNQVDAITVNTQGYSPDYTVELLNQNAAKSTYSWLVCGLTGWISEGEDHR